MNAADIAASYLRSSSNKGWQKFLRSQFHNLKIENDVIIRQIAFLDLRIATTNYDTVVEEILGLEPTLVTDLKALDRLETYSRYVFHLHGIYSKPETVLWSSTDYSRRLEDVIGLHIQNRIAERGLIMIGCGGTLDDPNFAQWRSFLSRVRNDGIVFRLYCDEEQHSFSSDYISIRYGRNFSDLGKFLTGVAGANGRALTPVVHQSGEKIRLLNPPQNGLNIASSSLSTRDREELLELTADLVAAYCAENPVLASEVPALIERVYNELVTQTAMGRG